jgi:hypothetical protein
LGRIDSPNVEHRSADVKHTPPANGIRVVEEGRD